MTESQSASPAGSKPTIDLDAANAARTVEEYIAAMPFGMGALNEKVGMTLLEVSPERVVATMPVEGNTQPYGLLHGGASVVLAETLGSVGSAAHVRPLGKLAVGDDINATHHRSATPGLVTGVATAIHLGRSSASYEVVFTAAQGTRVCPSRLPCALVPAERIAGAATGNAPAGA